jgi:hypothetical protein
VLDRWLRVDAYAGGHGLAAMAKTNRIMKPLKNDATACGATIVELARRH